MVEALVSSKAIYLNIYRTVSYLLLTHVTRLFFVLLATFTDTVLLQPHQMLFTGLIMDLLSVFVIAFSRPDPLVLHDKNDYEKKLTLLPIRQFPIVVLGACWGLLSLLTLKLALHFDPGYSLQAQNSLVFASFLIAQSLLLLSMANPPMFSGKGVRVNLIYLISIVVCVGFLVLVFRVTSFGSIFSVVSIGKIGYGLMFSPAVGSLILLEILKGVRERKK